ncbi:helix-turn-helix transcriptional regulator [Streptomyces sp. C1-2]|uniref:helix-turn-helix domain-containing protein n=1 Tax=Streptomyces sp. C1-2 TaxID=2720022 RepID=UPI00143274F0|nr:helix-turn-helix transcriptional regulator [Streptomyces sp. C1-2]
MPDEPAWIRDARQQQGDRIRRARLHANLTQERLAERTDLGRATIQRIEAGGGIKYVHLLVIARALDLRVADLVG